jgi:hypothetical protein
MMINENDYMQKCIGRGGGNRERPAGKKQKQTRKEEITHNCVGVFDAIVLHPQK